MSTPPVLFLIFNRKETALRSLESIRRAQPSQLFIAADGPRKNHDGELENCKAVRQAVLAAIDWDCKTQTLFRPENLGCKHAVSSAIDWFFEHVESGIIIEDDCVVSDSFFRFCRELLNRYQNNEKILSICANCFLPPGTITNASYYFSKYQHCWGWATWRRAWDLFDVNMKSWPEFKKNRGLVAHNEGCSVFEKHFTRMLDDVYFGRLDSWATIWLYTGWLHNCLNILPVINMSQNTGWSEDSTHTANEENWTASLKANEIPFPLTHPPDIQRNQQADRWSDINLWHIRRFQSLIHFFSKIKPLRVIYHSLVKMKYNRKRSRQKPSPFD